LNIYNIMNLLLCRWKTSCWLLFAYQ